MRGSRNIAAKARPTVAQPNPKNAKAPQPPETVEALELLRRGIEAPRYMKYSTPPLEYLFSDAKHKKLFDSRQHYQFPVRWVTSGKWAEFWQPHGKRGGGGISSVLPVAAMHSYPGAPLIVRPELPPPSADYEPWAYIGCRRLGTLSGIHYDSARRAMQDMAHFGLAEIRTIPGQHARGGREVWFSLSRKLFPSGGEEWRPIWATMLESATWAILPTSSARHLYMVLAALDPIQDEQKLKAAFDEQHGIGEPEEQHEKITHMRESAAVSQSDLLHLAGMRRSTLEEALAILTTPQTGENNTLPLVRSHRGSSSSRWYSLVPETRGWHFPDERLNKPGAFDVIRRETWPRLVRRTQPKRKRPSRRAA